MRGILVNQESGDLDIQNGSIAVGDMSLQAVEQILISSRGEYKENPLIGGEIRKMQHGSVSRFWPNRVKNMCRAMGLEVADLRITPEGKISLYL